ncbi:inositol phospholipid synthesis and fat-storage-inducing TM-domain-containing protein [Schizophyllum commune]
MNIHDVRLQALAATTATVALGTLYSVLANSYVDTSDPLLTHLPHPLGPTHFFANKANPLNTVFIKNAWGWTTAAAAIAITARPPRRALPQILRWGVATAVWLAFAGWFFGPSLIDRVTVASGGECVLVVPHEDMENVVILPHEYCYTGTKVSPETHPDLFTAQFDATTGSYVIPSSWGGLPRLRRGHDVSGHIFLLTMSILVLADQLRPLLKSQAPRTLARTFAIAVNTAMIALWIFAAGVTSVYFHTPEEKITGYLLGVVGFIVTLLVPMRHEATVRRTTVAQ